MKTSSSLAIFVTLIMIVICPPATAQIGQATLEGTQTVIKVIEVVDDLDLEGTVPDPGYKFIGLEVLIDNTQGTTSLKVFSGFMIKDAKGYCYEAFFKPGQEQGLMINDVDPGDFVRGRIFFEIPASSDSSTMRFRYRGFISGKTAWIPLSENAILPDEFLGEEISIASARLVEIGAIIRITALKDPLPSDREHIQPEEGKKFIGIEVLIDNTKGTATLDRVLESDFELKDAEGFYYFQPGELVMKHLTLVGSEVEAGDFLRGWIYYVVPGDKNASSMRIRYADAFMVSAWMPLSEQSATADTAVKKTPFAGPNQGITLTSVSAVIQNTNAVVRIEKLKDHLISAFQYVQPEEGYKFLGMQVMIDNTRGTEDIALAPRDFIAKDTKGFQYSSEVDLIVWPAFPRVTLETGDFVRGWIYFEIPDLLDITTLQARYESSWEKSDWIALSDVLNSGEALIMATPQPIDTEQPPIELTVTPAPVKESVTGPKSLKPAEPFVRFFGLILLMTVVPIGIQRFFKVPHSRLKNGILGSMVVLTYSIRHFSTVIAESPAVNRTGRYIADIFFLSVLLYSVIVGLHYERGLACGKKKKVIIILLIFVGICVSSWVYDNFYSPVMPFFPMIYIGIGILVLYGLITIILGTSKGVRDSARNLSLETSQEESPLTQNNEATSTLLPGSLSESAAEIVLTEAFFQQYNISPREQEVLQLLLQGKSNNDIAEALYVSRNTIKTHVRNIYAKLGISNRYELIYLLKQADQPQTPEQ